MTFVDSFKTAIKKGTDCGFLFRICLVALVGRIFFLIFLRDHLEVDTDAYLAHAQSLLDSGGYFKPGTEIPTSFRPPLVPLMYAGVLMLGGNVLMIGFLQVLLGTATVWYGGRAAWNLTNSAGGIFTALILAGDPILIYANVSLMTETLFTFLLAYGFFRATRISNSSKYREFFFLGCIGGLLALCRPGIWAFYLILFVGAFLLILKMKARQFCFLKGTTVGLGILLVVAPWGVRNYLTMGDPILMTTHGGYTLLLGNNNTFYEEVVRQPWGTIWQGDSLAAWQEQLEQDMIRDLGPERARLEIPRDHWMQNQAYDWISNNPAKFREASWLRLRRFWALKPNETPFENKLFDRGTTAVFGVIYLFAAWGIVMWFKYARGNLRQMTFVSALLVCMVSFCLIHTVYWSNMRMRAPVEVCLALLASGTVLKSIKLDSEIDPQTL
ncbi:MAG: glycosyltransferase family 39 protein [Planctomycetaceae bacterium]|nr:glycosyltransferase family 39 protein [Planctomycetaceae bacterium]